MNQSGVLVDQLEKTYPGPVRAVDGISFEVAAGEIYGLLGPNGAGKSTVVKVLTTLALPTSGTAQVGGFDVRTQPGEVRRIAGVALQEIGLDPVMKSLEMLRLQGRLFGMSSGEATRRAHELIELVGLSDATERRIRTYSGGMRRRLDLALALVHQPQVLFLDEPTTGLDPASRRDLWAEVKRLNRELQMTILLTTQYLEEADALADRVAIIDQGRIQLEGSPAELKAGVGSESINISFRNRELAEQARGVLAQLAAEIQRDRETIRLYLNRAAAAVPAVVRRLQQANLEPLSVTLTQPTLDDVFLKATGQRLAAPSGMEATQ
jgi:ABC-2 type transport system ATP-binding protein